jgi:hypothetical protein
VGLLLGRVVVETPQSSIIGATVFLASTALWLFQRRDVRS